MERWILDKDKIIHYLKVLKVESKIRVMENFRGIAML